MIDKNAIYEAIVDIWREIGEKEVRLEASGKSMLPLFNEGDVLIVNFTHPNYIKFGDVIVFKSPEGLIYHRVIGICAVKKKMYFIEKGDNTFNSSVITSENVVGRVIAIQKPGGIIKLDSKKWRIANYFITICSLLSLSVHRMGRSFKRVLIGNKKNCLIHFISRVFFFSISLFPKLLIKFLFFLQRSRPKPNTASNSPPSSPA